MTVVMPPRRAPMNAFHNKPYYPDLTVRRSTRLAVDVSPSPRRQPQPPPTKRRHIPIDLRANSPPLAHALKRSRVRLEVTPPAASSSKRKADSSLIEDGAHGEGSPSISSHRKKRKETAAVEKPPSPAHNQMRATLKNTPRARSSTNKYGTRSAPSIEPVHIINVDPAPVPPQPPSDSPPVSPSPASRQFLSPPPPPPEIKNDSTSEDPYLVPPEAMVIDDTATFELPQPVSEPCTPEPVANSSYVTYTDLTPFSSNAHLTVSLPSVFSPSILSELHDDFSFPADPDLDPTALLNPTDVGFPQPLQDQMGTTSACDNGSLDVHEWHRVARQKENDEARRQKMANQRRDHLWTNLTDQKYREFVRNHGIEEVRARVKADTQKAEVAARLYQGLSPTTDPVTPSQPTMEAEPELVSPFRSSFEMYSPDTDECEVDEKFADDDDDDDDDYDDSDESIEDDIAPDPNFDLPPPLIVSPFKANPMGGRVTMFGTPPFLERRQAWGGTDLVNLSMNHSINIQQLRPARKFPEPPPGIKLPPPSSFPVPPSMRPPPPPAPSFPQISDPPTPDFTNDPESYADPAIMQAIIASMSPPGIDFNFGNVNWGDGATSSVPEANQVDMASWQSSGLESSFSRCSPVLTSSSTLHSALG